MSIDDPRVLKWTQDDLYAMDEANLLELKDRRVELIDGQILVFGKQEPLYCAVRTHARGILSDAFGEGWYVQEFSPLDVGEYFLPIPDLAMIRGKIRDRKAHPTSADLIVEVAVSSVKYDRTDKASVYARAGIQDYWIINVTRRRVEVFRQPIANVDAPFGFRYAEVQTFEEDKSIRPLAKPDALIAVADLLP
jgi:Uma2 family endonuclease